MRFRCIYELTTRKDGRKYLQIVHGYRDPEGKSKSMPTLSEVKKEYNIGRVVVVADKGLNSGDNIAFNTALGDIPVILSMKQIRPPTMQ